MIAKLPIFYQNPDSLYFKVYSIILGIVIILASLIYLYVIIKKMIFIYKNKEDIDHNELMAETQKSINDLKYINELVKKG
jgi:hypothetical protein